MNSQVFICKMSSPLIALAAFLVQPAQLSAQGTATSISLQALVNDTAAQIQLAYRLDPAERQRRHEQLEEAVKSWRTVQRSDANNRLLAEWLRAAMRNSMPGSVESLPAPPAFDTGATSILSAQAAEREASRTIGDKSAGDPFGDDPLPAQE
jgi:hypothetical protein